MVKIDITVFEIVGGGELKPPPPLRIVSCLKKPGSDRVKQSTHCNWSKATQTHTRNYAANLDQVLQ